MGILRCPKFIKILSKPTGLEKFAVFKGEVIIGLILELFQDIWICTRIFWYIKEPIQ